MPIKLRSTEHKVIVVTVLVAAVSLGIGIKYFWRAFPEAAIEFRVNRDDSAPIAQKFLVDRGLRLEGYRHAAIFDYDDEAKVYLERTQGLVRMNALTRGPIRLWQWSHRWFRPQQKEEFRVDVTPAGQVVGYQHDLLEAAPGANLDAAAARTLAETFLREVMQRNLNDLEFVEAQREKRPARTDHTFVWKQKSVDLGDGSLRVAAEVDGDQVAAYREYIKIPEQWSRDYDKLRSRNTSAQIVAEVFFVLLTLALLVILVRRLRDRDVPVRLAWAFGAVAAVLYFLGEVNTFSLAAFGYRTTDSYSSFVAGYLQTNLLVALGYGAFIFLLVAGSEPVYRENYPGLISLRRYLNWQGLRSRSFFMANVVGIGLTFFFFAYQTVFYLAAEKLGAWAPADIPFTNLLNTAIPWVSVLFIGFFPAVSEEMQFRAFAIPYLGRLLRSKLGALVLAAFIWGFLHSAYPNQPFFIRGLEVGLGGILVGFLMLRFGILAVLIWHYSVDALYTAFLLLRSPNHYLMISGGITAGIMLVPLIVALVTYWRSGTFSDEAPLTNSVEGISRLPRREIPEEQEVPLTYQPLARGRLLLAGILTVVFLAVTMIPVPRFGEGIKLGISREEAIRRTNEYLGQKKVDFARYHVVATLDENVDPLAIRYLLERRSVAETDRIYQQATRLLLWQVRYFRPLEKEEHLVYVDPTNGQIFACQRLLDENAAGASLSVADAQALAEKALEREGYRLADFDRQEVEEEKRKARQDYTFVWQAKPGDPRNVDKAFYRLQVAVAGDQVIGVSRFFKLPEDWVRQRRATGLTNALLLGMGYLLLLGMVGGILILFVKQVRSGQIPWRPALKVGGAVACIMALVGLNQLPSLYTNYNTSIPLAPFQLMLWIGMLVTALLIGLLAWLAVGLVLSIYPQAGLVVRASARRRWRGDAVVAIVLGLAAIAAYDELTALITSRFHVYAPVSIDLLSGPYESLSPGAGFFLRALFRSVLYAAVAALAIYVIRLGLARRAWWLGVGVLLGLVSLGPPRAHSVPEFLLGWIMVFAAVLIGVCLVALFFRDNALAYLAAAFCVPLLSAVVSLLTQPAPYFRWNGALLLALILPVLGWLFVPWRERQSS
jgi:membrane protease YdiL (CAAX protease family)